MLLARKEVYPDMPDNNRRTPLSHAAEHVGDRFAKILLGREEVHPDTPDNSGRTPLMPWMDSHRQGVRKEDLQQPSLPVILLQNAGMDTHKNSLAKTITLNYQPIIPDLWR